MPKEMYEDDVVVENKEFDNYKSIEEEKVREKAERKKSKIKSKSKKKIKRTLTQNILFYLKKFLIVWMSIGFVIALIVVFRNTELVLNFLPNDIRHILLNPLKNVKV